jgi:hypothetical protein
MSEIVSTNPFGESHPVDHGSLGGLVAAEQQRAVAEVQAALIFAHTKPRDPRRCMDVILNECQRQTLAEEAIYSYVRGGNDISGPSIRLAETIMRGWRNMVAGVKVLSRRDGVSECLAYAWDLESNVREERGFAVRHWRDTKQGGYPLRDERDISELELNIGSRRKRACILGLIPGDVIDVALRQCEYTMNSKIEVTPELVADMLAKLEPFGITREMVEKRIQRRIDAIQPANIASLRKIYTSLRDGMGAPGDWFEMPDDPAANVTNPPASSRTAAAKSSIKANLKAGAKTKGGAAATTGKDAPPVVTYAEVAEALNQAKDRDAANVAADLIKHVTDPQQRKELGALYSGVTAKFDQQGEH